MALNVFDRLIQAIPEQELVESDIAFPNPLAKSLLDKLFLRMRKSMR